MSMDRHSAEPRAEIEAWRTDRGPRYLQWSPILLGAFAATALCFSGDLRCECRSGGYVRRT